MARRRGSKNKKKKNQQKSLKDFHERFKLAKTQLSSLNSGRKELGQWSRLVGYKNEPDMLAEFARKKGAKDKVKRKKRIGAAAVLSGATIGLSAGAGSELGYRAEKFKVNKRIEELTEKLSGLKNPQAPRGRMYTKGIQNAQQYLGSRRIKVVPRLLGVGGGLAVGTILASTLFAPAITKEGARTSEAERKRQNRRTLSSLNQTSREARGYLSLAARYLK